ncbi:hypothetical protein [Vulcanisaeta sp. JCM 16159]|uniref:hypothetical protein n=1 Tax=Vulcanisaeta sp. JCM 16159 TaxID=1295371 RepID=UPI001FB24962|nr:hypothetical protein [Vulcanisaeta sp. JCM 16159]
MAQVGNEEQIIKEIMNALSGSARYMSDEIRSTFSKYVDIYRGISGFETQQVSLGTVENSKRVFLIQSSITEPNYDPNNYLVNAFKGFFNIDENFFPTYLMGGIECYMQSAPSESTGVKVSGPMVSIYNGVESVEDKDLGRWFVRRRSVLSSRTT